MELQQEQGIQLQPVLAAINADNTSRAENLWLACSNQLIGLGVLEAGIPFVAACPITPASDVLEWMVGEIASGG